MKRATGGRSFARGLFSTHLSSDPSQSTFDLPTGLDINLMLKYRLLLSCLLLCLTGCGGGGGDESTLDVYPVNGTVTVDGKPLPSVTVFFMPAEGTSGLGAGGVTDETGAFTLKYKDDRDGVPAGTYRVLFSRLVKPDGSSIGNDEIAIDVGAVNQIADIYNDPEKTPVSATVGKTNEPYKFEVKSKGK